jgi:hypothetical protein
MTPMPPSPFLNPAACDAAAGTVAAALTSPGCAAAGPSAADLWSRGEALLAEIYAYLASNSCGDERSASARTFVSSDTLQTAQTPKVMSVAPGPHEVTFDLDADRFMAELDEPPLFLRSA